MEEKGGERKNGRSYELLFYPFKTKGQKVMF